MRFVPSLALERPIPRGALSAPALPDLRFAGVIMNRDAVRWRQSGTLLLF